MLGGPRHLLVIHHAALAHAALAAAVAPAVPTATIPPRRTTTIVVAPDRGAPLEHAVPGPTFALAVAADAEQRWSEAATLYQQAVVEWSDRARERPSPALDLALAKAERERQRSQLLASEHATRPQFDGFVTQVNPLDEGRLLRAKLMVVRATRGRVPVGLATRAREALDEALRDPGARPAALVEARLLLCATRAAAGDRAGARLDLAGLSDAQRRDLDNALPLAICAAALGDDDEALARLEMFALRPAPHQPDPFVLRDLYLANDWDRLRGQPRFETLFAAALTP